MKYMHSEWIGRLNHWMDTLQKDFYIPVGELELEAFFTAETLTPKQAAERQFTPVSPGAPWGTSFTYAWFRAGFTLPPEAEGFRIVMDLKTGGESTLFVNGKAFGTYRADWVRTPYHYLLDNVLTPCAKAGETYTLLMETYAGHYFPNSSLGGCATGPVLPNAYQDPKTEGKRVTLERCSYGIWNEDAYQLYLDADTLRQLMDMLDPDSLRADKLAKALETFTLAVDFEQPFAGRVADYQKARAVLRQALEARNGDTMPVFYAVGNAHLDLAWLWPRGETVRKTARTFAAQLRMLEAYPAYRFLQSQPAAYELCREHYPELYAEIRKAVAGGRWIAEGAMWVEPDTNMTSGESLIRQLLHGKRYFRDMFGIDSVLLWLPDTFGYTAALPQILKGCGVRYLVTQKIFWSYNEGDQFPYHYFHWQGSDGTTVDTFLPTSYTYRTDPKELMETWSKRVQKRGLDTFLLPFGYGDGGGGPCRDHLEYALRAEDLEGEPKVKMASPLEFFRDMEDAGGPQHTYTGELYFSAHRGVFTSQAAIKKWNRKNELALREVELWGALAMTKGWQYPLARMDAAWKKLLFNQFHDILPGSSIAKVYEEARADHGWIASECAQVLREAQRALLEGGGITVCNSLSVDRTEVIAVPESLAHGAVTADGVPVPVTQARGQAYALVSVPSCGYVSLLPNETACDVGQVTATIGGDTIVLQNELVRIALNRQGEMVSYLDKGTQREFAAAPMNRLCLFKDVPRLYDAWDIDSNYALQPIAIDTPVEISIEEPGGLRAVVRVQRRIGNSQWSQEIVLTACSRRVDFVTSVDWDELHRLLKVSFPMAVNAAEAINEIQFGYLSRPTHRSRLYDSDRFEVCNHRYTALCDTTHGAAVLNDCKYGVSQLHNDVRLTLLRAAASPEMRADHGLHTFTYAFIGWEGSFADAPVVREAYQLNVPLLLAEGRMETFSAFSLDNDHVWIDTVKSAEDGSGDLILRLYEAKRGDVNATLRLGIAAREIWECDMLENKKEKLPIADRGVRLHFHVFEVKTLRIAMTKPKMESNGIN